jgi:6-phosphogluconolactonase
MANNARRTFGIATACLALVAALSPHLARAQDGPFTTGKVFTATNSPAGNELIVLGRAADGSLALVDRLATQGLGTGAGLGSQGAVALSGDGRMALVVNAASHTLSMFSLTGTRPTLVSVVDSGGLAPISVSESNGLVYVLNAGGAGNVAGFRLAPTGLQPIPGSTRALSAAGGTGPAQVGFSSDGGTLLVTEKATNRLVSWRVDAQSGLLGAPTITPSSGITPFGFAFDNRDRVFVSEAVGGAALASTTSSYRFAEQQPAKAVLVSASVPTMQTAACWVAVTPNGKFAYTGNAGSSSISLYQVGRDGSLALGEAAAGVTGSGTGVTDLAVSRSGQALYALAPGATRVVAFEVGADGRLAPSSTLTGLPGLLVGLAAN